MVVKQSKIYKRLFFNYLFVIVFLIITLDSYFINRFSKSNIDSSIYINEKVVYDINEEVDKVKDTTDEIIENMYNDLSVLEDILLFMSTDNISYLKNKLNKLSESNNSFYNGIEKFVASSFRLNANLEEIIFVSYDNLEKNSFNRSNQIKTIRVDPQELVSKSVITNKNIIQFAREIRNPVNLNSEGLIILQYNFDNIKNVYKKYQNNHEILLMDENCHVVYSSDEEYEYEEYEYCEEILNNNGQVKLQKNYYIDKIVNPLGIVSVAKIEKNQAIKLPIGLITSIIIVNILVLVISLAIIYDKLSLLGKRTDNIVLAMNEVTNGNLDVQIPITSDNDEINYISENFNKMCKDLDDYIKKVYLSQVEQKKAEMMALQNQINPHFLYNTLESIRMKAISNGDREVGKMLYTLAFLFRMQVKDDHIITLKDELNYCEKYIEIFKFRYEDQFSFEINCPKELEECKIIKFSIQPLIENYFVHGIRLEDYDNALKINIVKINEDILIKIIDNGKGMCEADMEMINNKLVSAQKLGDSIGITNVHERISSEYGEEYGVEFAQNSSGGVTATIKILCRGV